jgi:hypothetical protein
LKTSSLALLVLAIVVVVSLTAIWFAPTIQDYMAGNTMWNGINNFSSEFKCKNIDSLSVLPETAGKSVLISIPYLEYNTEDLDRIKKFVADGNTLLIMDDFGFGNDILAYLGLEARFDNHIVLDPLFCYKNEYLPRITDFAPEIKGYGVQAINFNHATILNNVPDAQGLAWSSRTSFLDVNGNGSQGKDEPAGPFVAAARYKVGKGTVELVGDPSLIINTMMIQNDNNKFIKDLIEFNGPPAEILLDRAHLSKSPLDISKITLVQIRAALTNPYVLVGLIAVIFVLVIALTLEKGELFG